VYATNTPKEAATLPLVLTTSALALFRRQHLPLPWSPRPASSSPLPLIIYGASGAVGTFAIKLALASNIHPIIAIAGGSSSHLTTLLEFEKGDALIDYRAGTEEMIKAVKENLNGIPCYHAFDTISSKGTWVPVTQMLAPSTEMQRSVLSVDSGAYLYDELEIPEGVQVVYTYVGTAHDGAYRKGMPKQDGAEEVTGDVEWTGMFFRYVSEMLEEGG
jgi:NADPH2:quinone reductase